MGGPKCFSFAYGDPRRADVVVLICAPADADGAAGADDSCCCCCCAAAAAGAPSPSPPAAAAPAAAAAAAARAAGLRVCLEVPGHAILLEEASAWARAALRDEWAGRRLGGSHHAPRADGAPGTPSTPDNTTPGAPGAPPVAPPPATMALRMVVDDEGQAAAGALLLAAMYCGDGGGALAGASQLQLLQVLQLADRFQAPRAAAAATRLLLATPPAAADWAAVAAAYALPPGARELPALSAAAGWAREAVRSALGDLEAALRQEEAARKLRALPLAGVVELLEDDNTAAASENTAYCAAAEWLRAAPGRATPAARAALAAALRAPRLSPLMLATAAPRCRWLGRHFSGADLLAAAALASFPDPSRAEDLLFSPGQPAARHAAWRRPARRRPAAGGMELRIDVRADQMRELHAAAAAAALAALAAAPAAPPAAPGAALDRGAAAAAAGGEPREKQPASAGAAPAPAPERAAPAPPAVLSKVSIAGPPSRFNGWEGFLEIQARTRPAPAAGVASAVTSSVTSSERDSSNGVSRRGSGAVAAAEVEVEFGLFVRLQLPRALREMMDGEWSDDDGCAAGCGGSCGDGCCAAAASGAATTHAEDGGGAPTPGAKRGQRAPAAEAAAAAAGAPRPAAVCCADSVELIAYAPAAAAAAAAAASAAGVVPPAGLGSRAGGGAAARRVQLGRSCFSEDKGWGLPGFFGVAPSSSWDARPWREAGLLGEDGRLAAGALVAGLR